MAVTMMNNYHLVLAQIGFPPTSGIGKVFPQSSCPAFGLPAG